MFNFLPSANLGNILNQTIFSLIFDAIYKH